MQTWCTTSEVDDLVKGSPSQELLLRYAEYATSVLYDVSGSCFSGEATVETSYVVNTRGIVKLNDWQPVRDVTTATIDDEPVPFRLSPAGTYVVVDRRHVGETLVLVLEVGQDPPTSGRLAAAALAAELLRGDPSYAETIGADDVRPPFRVTSISRQGVTYTYTNPSDATSKGRTGIYEVDLFLAAVNPNNVRRQPKVAAL